MAEHIGKRLLFLDDDAAFSREFCDVLRAFDFNVRSVTSFPELLQALRSAAFDLLVLDQFVRQQDVLLSLMDIRKLHDKGIIILTGNADRGDLIIGLELGADDFVHKQQQPREVLARIRAVMRRRGANPAESEAQQVGSDPPEFLKAAWTIDRMQREVYRPTGQPLQLTAMEFALVGCMASHHGQVLERAFLYQEVFNRLPATESDRSLDNLVSRVRRLMAPYCDDCATFKSARGYGYSYVGPVLTDVTTRHR